MQEEILPSGSAVLWYVDVSMPMDTDSVTKITYN